MEPIRVGPPRCKSCGGLIDSYALSPRGWCEECEQREPAPAPPEHWREAVERALPCTRESYCGSLAKAAHISSCAASLRPAVLCALASVDLAAAASELRLRAALESRAVGVLTRMDGDRVGWRSYKCSLCGGTWENDEGPGHDSACPLAAPPSPAAEALAELLALPGRWASTPLELEYPDSYEAGVVSGMESCARELRVALAKLGGTT
jgi:hypothetical protein